MKRVFPVILLVVASLLTSCAQDDSKKDVVIKISTKHGDMFAILYDKTPKHKANFIKLAKEGYFNGTVFHRIIKDFMIQGGDPDSKTAKPGQRLGNGGPGYSIPAEILPEYYHERGALAAARLPDNQNPARESSGSQFYIVQGKKIEGFELETVNIDKPSLNKAMSQFLREPKNSPVLDSLRNLQANNELEAIQEKVFSLIPRLEKQTGIKIRLDNPEKIKTYSTIGGYPTLDGEYTVFGKVVKGLEVIDRITTVQTDETDRPVEDIPMTVTVEEMSRKKITKLYGVQYPPDQK